MKRGILLALLAGTLLSAGCGGAYVGFYAPGPPPPIRVETYGPAPGPGYVWVNGYWGYRGGRYEWVGGRWDRPPQGRRAWVAGRWEHHGSQYRWRDGRWR
jgi:hypothetical protein